MRASTTRKDFGMKISTTLAAVIGCAGLAACSGGTDEDVANVDNGIMIDNLGTTDMNMGTDLNIGTDMNTSDMNADMDMNVTGDTTNDVGMSNTTD